MRIDSLMRVVFSSVHFRPYRSFEELGPIVVLPSVGVHMVKAKLWLRSILPPEAAHLHKVWQQHIAGGYTLVPGAACVLCKANDTETRMCPLCLQSTHHACCVMTLHVAISEAIAASDFSSILPRTFRVPGMLCPICTHFVK